MAALGVRFDLRDHNAMVKGLPWHLGYTHKAGPQKTPVDFTGWSARLVIDNPLDADQAPVEFSTASGHIVLGGIAGTVDIDLDETDTQLAGTRARYRLYLVDSLGKGRLLLRGSLALVEENE